MVDFSYFLFPVNLEAQGVLSQTTPHRQPQEPKLNLVGGDFTEPKPVKCQFDVDYHTKPLAS